MACDLSSGFFLISDQRHYTFLYGHTKYNREGGGKEQMNGQGSAPSAWRGRSMWHFLQLSMHLQAIAGVYFARNFHKAMECCAVSWLSSLPCFHFLTASFCWLCPSLDNYLKPTVLFCPPLSTDSLSSLGPSFPPPFPVSWEISPSGPFCGFCAKTDKAILRPAPKQTEMNATHCVTRRNYTIKLWIYWCTNVYFAIIKDWPP